MREERAAKSADNDVVHGGLSRLERSRASLPSSIEQGWHNPLNSNGFFAPQPPSTSSNVCCKRGTLQSPLEREIFLFTLLSVPIGDSTALQYPHDSCYVPCQVCSKAGMTGFSNLPLHFVTSMCWRQEKFREEKTHFYYSEICNTAFRVQTSQNLTNNYGSVRKIVTRAFIQCRFRLERPAVLRK